MWCRTRRASCRRRSCCSLVGFGVRVRVRAWVRLRVRVSPLTQAAPVVRRGEAHVELLLDHVPMVVVRSICVDAVVLDRDVLVRGLVRHQLYARRRLRDDLVEHPRRRLGPAQLVRVRVRVS